MSMFSSAYKYIISLSQELADLEFIAVKIHIVSLKLFFKLC
jgi:hypothetical protein